MFCKNCGAELDDNAEFCPNCGVATDKFPEQNLSNKASETNKMLSLLAKIFIIIGMVCGCWVILPLIFGALGLSALSKGKPSIGMSVCVLLFCSLVGGILMLCIKEDY